MSPKEIDISWVTPDKLGTITDEHFRAVVNADLRRSAAEPPSMHPDIHEALRGDYFDRWFRMLNRMAGSVAGQLETRATEHESSRAKLRAELHRIDSDNVMMNPGLAKAAVEAQLEDLNAKYFSRRAGTLRFRSSLDEALAEARSERGLDEVVAARNRELTAAIVRHRQRVLDDGEDLEPTDADIELWNTIGLSSVRDA